MTNDIFQIYLDDYALPGFVSGEKSYFGTMPDIEAFMVALQASKEDESRYNEIIDSYGVFLKENKSKKHTVADNAKKQINPVALIAKKNFAIPCKLNWVHINIWGYPYYMSADHCNCSYIWVRTKSSYIRAVKAKFKNLCYGVEENDKTPVRTLWGFPCVLDFEHKQDEDASIFSRLYVIDRIFKTEHDLLHDVETFDGLGDFSGFCNDIFADG